MSAFSNQQRRRGVRAVALTLFVAELYFLDAQQLELGGLGELGFFLTTIPALLLAVALVVSCLPLRDDLPALLVLIAGGALFGALLSAPAAELASPFKALFAAGVGFALARLIPVASIVYLLAVAVAIADAVSVSVGPTHYLVTEKPDVVNYLALTLPNWGSGASQLGVSDLIFTAVYLATAWRFDLRRRATIIGIALSLTAALGLAILTDWIVPALPLLSIGFIAPNADRVWRQLREELSNLE